MATKIETLKIEYSTLSSVEELFPRKSTHVASNHINKRMTEILAELKELETPEPVESTPIENDGDFWARRERTRQLAQMDNQSMVGYDTHESY